MKRDLRFEHFYAHPPERVWTALTDSAALAEWLMPNDFVARLGQRFQFRTDPAPGFDGIVNCEVLSLDPPRELSYSWRGGPLDTVLSFRLSAEAGGTRLVVEQRGFSGIKALLVARILSGGWKRIYEERLPALLQRLEQGLPPSGAGAESADCSKEWSEKGQTRMLARIAALLPGKPKKY